MSIFDILNCNVTTTWEGKAPDQRQAAGWTSQKGKKNGAEICVCVNVSPFRQNFDMFGGGGRERLSIERLRITTSGLFFNISSYLGMSSLHFRQNHGYSSLLFIMSFSVQRLRSPFRLLYVPHWMMLRMINLTLFATWSSEALCYKYEGIRKSGHVKNMHVTLFLYFRWLHLFICSYLLTCTILSSSMLLVEPCKWNCNEVTWLGEGGS